jgi:hypothetical protein
MAATNVTPILCVTRDEQGAVATTVATIYSALFCLRKTPHYIQTGALGYAKARTNLSKEARKAYGTDKVRGFLLDDDVRLLDQKALEKVIKISDQNGWNVVAPYRTKSGRFSIVRTCPPKPSGTVTEMITQEDLAKIKPYDEIEMAGLGFYYGDIPLDYEFHEGNPYTGEDLNFFHDNPWIHPRLAPLYLEHLKVLPLEGAMYELSFR